jgi:hypothetical protein
MDTIKSKSKTVELESGRRIKVQRMRWKAARGWLRKFGDSMSKMMSGGLFDENAGISELLKSLPAIIEQSDSLVADLVAASTPLKPEEFDELDTLEASAVIQAAVEVNFDDDLKNCWSGVLKGISTLMGSKVQTPTTPSGEPMPVLYEQGLTPPTSTSARSTTSTSLSGR